MRLFDHDFAADVIARLRALEPDAKPAWGTLTPERMVSHLALSVRYSLGQAGVFPDKSNWLLRNVVCPLLLHGMLPMPKNVKLTAPVGVPPDLPMSDDLETLHALLEEYLDLVQADELAPPRHAFFGDIGVDGWARLHVIHFEHHLRQFGL